MPNYSIAVTELGGAAGTLYYSLVFTNTSKHTVVFRGVPNVVFVDDDGMFSAYATPTSDDGKPPETVKIDPGLKAYAQLAIPDPGNYGPPPYSSVSWLVVTAPDHFPQLVQVATPLSLNPAHAGTIAAIESTEA